ncbi:hypothetical protein [Synechococcus sp. CC9616]|uniref:hypothetical protein n=1 Tax=Synechococcus sp. CC9616 TaxID=110663 RepID=UPI000490CA5C|nr:hypothetical protein [Synechococcus sp. CC9616]
MSGPLWLGLSVLLSGCALQQLSVRPEAVELAQVQDQSQAVVQTVAASPAPPQPKPMPPLPGQDGPTAELLQGGDLRLTPRRSEQTFPDGNRIWMVELHRGDRLLARWKAASGIAQRQDADRLWSPGNAAPLPAGRYSLGRPEPWGEDLWFDLQPRFETSRSALGIHRCYPGTGCICIPSRAEIDALAAWVRAANLQTLSVVN